MSIIFTSGQKEGTRALAARIVSSLNEGKRVLWLIPGGSNIPIAKEAMDIIRQEALPSVLGGLTIALTDERYGPVGHPDSNWQQLQDVGIDFSGIKAYPILDGSTLEETVGRYGTVIDGILPDIDVIVGQFGMGADGHIAGILPHTSGVAASGTTCGYVSAPFTRVSLTFAVLRKISAAYMFVSSSSKKDAIESLRHDGISLDDQPAQILKEMPEAHVYID